MCSWHSPVCEMHNNISGDNSITVGDLNCHSYRRRRVARCSSVLRRRGAFISQTGHNVAANACEHMHWHNPDDIIDETEFTANVSRKTSSIRSKYRYTYIPIFTLHRSLSMEFVDLEEFTLRLSCHRAAAAMILGEIFPRSPFAMRHLSWYTRR